jgi:hypothetical protein
MNYQKKIAYQIITALFLVLQIFTNGYASDATMEVDLTGGPKLVRVKGTFSENSKITNRQNFAFLSSIAGANELGKRILEVQLFDRAGQTIEVKRFAPGEYVAASDYHAWEYTIDLTPPKNRAAAAHVSWVDAENGILMTDDILPQFVANGMAASADIKLNNLPGWKSYSTDAIGAAQEFRIDELTKGVIYVGGNFRERTIIGDNDLRLVLSGDWHFTDEEALQMAEEIFREYSQMFGSPPSGPTRIAIFKFPGAMNAGVWEAETRGKSVTILSSEMPFRMQSLQRLHEQLRHEIFHLWIPNGLNLKGNYAWFYEGFALYQSLKTAVAMNRIRFDDFLDTLSRAYSIDVRQTPRRPLIDAENRSIGMANTQIYARGVLIAFLLDIDLLRSTRGKAELRQVLRRIFISHKPPSEKVDGNKALLVSIGERDITTKYILGSEMINMERELAGSGIVLETSGRSSVLRVMPKPSGRGKEILDRLGYNNWRKSTGHLKK